MQTHELKNPTKRKAKKKIGRGGKRGTYSGKGQKGQRARSGHRIRPAIRDLLSKLPKLRGVKHKSLRAKAVVISLGDLEKKMKDVSVVTKKALVERGLLQNEKAEVKVLNNGEVKKAFTIEGLSLSAKAREKIEKAGGQVKEK